MRMFALILLAAAGCSSSSDEGPQGVPNGLNECATKGATYVVHCVERAGGSCGALTDEVLHLDATTIGQIGAVRCAESSQSGCTASATDCKQHVQVQGGSCDVLETYSTTFKQDGSSATSIDTRTISCSDGSGCKSTYDCTITRK